MQELNLTSVYSVFVVSESFRIPQSWFFVIFPLDLQPLFSFIIFFKILFFERLFLLNCSSLWNSCTEMTYFIGVVSFLVMLHDFLFFALFVYFLPESLDCCCVLSSPLIRTWAVCPGVVVVLDYLFSKPETSLISPSNSRAVSAHALYLPVFPSGRGVWVMAEMTCKSY